MDPEEIANCQFIPLSAIQKAMDFIGTSKEQFPDNCKRNLLKLQKQIIIGDVNKAASVSKEKYHNALYKAINSHDWNKLLYLLKKSPIWQHTANHSNGRTNYIRALAILMMYHPSAQSQNMLKEYLHMVCSCRTNEEKRAFMKLILMLPEKIVEQEGVYPCQSKGRSSF